ncbi:MAG: hypothetical protein GX330_06360 [Bacteroidales bacterium]|nr:hypothetical protein [Bacteroidales bacterium]
MKTFKVITVLLLSSLMLTFSSCGLKKMVKKQSSVSYSVTPNPLEAHGGKMTMEIQGTYPQKYFNKKATLSLEPIIKTSEGETVRLPVIHLEGEKVKGDNQTIGYKAGGKFTYNQTIDYKPMYENCELILEIEANLKKKSATLDPVKLADGTINTSEKISVEPKLSYPDEAINGSFFVLANHNYKGPQVITETGIIYFELNRDVLNWNLPFNQKEENKEALNNLITFISESNNILSVDILGWASPEGELKRNQELSSNRSATGKKWFEREYDKFIRNKARAEKVRASDIKKDIKYEIKDNGEDWDGFIEALENSSIQDKSKIINVIKSQNDMDQREQQIRNMIAIYDEVDNEILPSLRRAIIKVNVMEDKKTDEEIAELAANNPESLSNDELLYAASLTNDMKTKAEIYTKATQIFTNNYRGYNDLACVKYLQGEKDEALTMLNKAKELNPNNSEVLNNFGIISFLDGDIEKAKEYFEASKKAGFDQSYNLGVVYMKIGDYTAAINNFSTSKCDYNVALNQLLSKDYTAAKATIDCIQNKTAKDYYLLAIISARTNDTNILYKSLVEACKLDPELKKQALKDIEFRNYKNNAAFKDALK